MTDDKCDRCDGTGAVDAPFSDSDPCCPDCDGTGRVEVEYTVGGVGPAGPWQGYAARMVECERCRGWGVVDEE